MLVFYKDSFFQLQNESHTNATDFVFETIITGADLASSTVQQDSFGQNFVVAFELKEEAADIFEDYTGTHRGQFLTIVLDKQVVSSPRINDVIRDTGSITGDFTLEDAQKLALQLQLLLVSFHLISLKK